MDTPYKMYELTRLDDLERLSRAGWLGLLQAMGIETDIWESELA